jgi:3-methyl-2-oxobutanoate hydroxymethyltransferase
VLVLQDMLGMNKTLQPKFLRHYLNGFDLIKDAINKCHSDVIKSKYPSKKESYS